MPRNQMDLGWRFAARANVKPAVVKRGRRGRTMEERFWEKVDKRGPDECWEWTGSKSDVGYGMMKNENGRPEQAHRMAWRIHNGPIPKGLCVCHAYDNKPCVNPAHLWIGTRKQNQQDMARKGRTGGHKRYALTGEEASEVRRDRKAGATIASMANRFGVCLQTIRDILKRKTHALELVEVPQ